MGGSGIANHELLLGNSSNLDSSAVISVVSVLAPTKQEPEESSSNDELDIYQLPRIDKEFFIPARSMISIKLSEIDGVAGEYAAALIQSNLGSLIVSTDLVARLERHNPPARLQHHPYGISPRELQD